jgi:hypothetical protein
MCVLIFFPLPNGSYKYPYVYRGDIYSVDGLHSMPLCSLCSTLNDRESVSAKMGLKSRLKRPNVVY